jgi:hypothetical protein
MYSEQEDKFAPDKSRLSRERLALMHARAVFTVFERNSPIPRSHYTDRKPRAHTDVDRSLFSVAEHSTSVALDVSPVVGGKAGGRAAPSAPISASLQELQGLDERRNKYLESLANRDRIKQAAPISNTLAELQERQVNVRMAPLFMCHVDASPRECVC